jgi:hypothetical protein
MASGNEFSKGFMFNPPEEFVTCAKEYYSSDFPNPDRVGCSGISVLNRLLRIGGLPGDALRAHLFSCSECFREYREVLSTRRKTTPVEVTLWRNKLLTFFARKPAAIFACLIFLIVLTITIIIWKGYTQTAVPGVAQKEAKKIPAL